MKNQYHICCSTDNKYARHCATMLCSLLENSNSTYIVHLLYTEGKLNVENKNKISSLINKYNSTCIFHNVNEDKLQGVKFRINRPLSYAAYYRVLLASIIDPSIDYILYLDCDIVVLKDISYIFNLDISQYALAAVQDITNPCELQRNQLSIPYEECFFCSGVMLINLKYWRINNAEEKLLEYSKKERFVFLHDQDALNAVFYNSWFRLSPIWNKFNMQVTSSIRFLSEQDRKDFIKDPIIIHYLVKPWFGLKGVRYTKEYLYYLSLSGFKYENERINGNKLKIYIQILMTNIRIMCEDNGLIWIYYIINLPYLTFLYLLKLLMTPLSFAKYLNNRKH